MDWDNISSILKWIGLAFAAGLIGYLWNSWVNVSWLDRLKIKRTSRIKRFTLNLLRL